MASRGSRRFQLRRRHYQTKKGNFGLRHGSHNRQPFGRFVRHPDGAPKVAVPVAMTAERTPFAVLMTALGESLGLPSPAAPNSGPYRPAPSNLVAQRQCSQKKRKRTVACGHCDACGRDDCGKCLNCLDKPKFGGQGIRKQSCLERKCRFPTSATITSLTVSTPDEPTPAEARPPPKPANRDRQEWDEFWGAVDCCMRLQSSPNLGSAIAEREEHASKKARTARCGSCAGCVRGDCGQCKNCLDKPKFGGRGIKKQACLSRVCCNPQEHEGVESPGASPLCLACAWVQGWRGGGSVRPFPTIIQPPHLSSPQDPPAHGPPQNGPPPPAHAAPTAASLPAQTRARTSGRASRPRRASTAPTPRRPSRAAPPPSRSTR